MVRSLRIACWAVLVVVLCACGTTGGPTGPTVTTVTTRAPATSQPATQPASPTETPSGNVLHYVAFGDSWPEGAHCGRCRTFAGLWADGLETLTGRPVEFTDMTGQREPSAAESKASASLLGAVQSNEATRTAIAAADIILIATGPNELDLVFEPSQQGTCGGADGADCIRALGETWTSNFEAILAEIESLRAGRPTVIRLVDAANAFLFEPGMTAGMPAGFATGNGALIYKLLNDAMCKAAKDHHAVCIDIRPILNGPTMDQPADENSAASMRAVADALLESGIAELQGPSPSP